MIVYYSTRPSFRWLKLTDGIGAPDPKPKHLVTLLNSSF